MTSGRSDHELVDILDQNGAVIDVVERRTMRERRLPHRSTYVAVLNVEPGLWPTKPRLDENLASHGWSLAACHHEEALAELRSLVAPSTTLVVHQRAAWKDVYPSYWDVGFGGVCGAGEPWTTSAERELAEEAGIVTSDGSAALGPIGHGRFHDNSGTVFGVVYAALTLAKAKMVDGEVVALDEVQLCDLEAWTEDRPVCPDSLDLVVPMLRALL